MSETLHSILVSIVFYCLVCDVDHQTHRLAQINVTCNETKLMRSKALCCNIFREIVTSR